MKIYGWLIENLCFYRCPLETSSLTLETSGHVSKKENGWEGFIFSTKIWFDHIRFSQQADKFYCENKI